MTIDTDRSLRGRARTLTVWAGRLLVFIGILHLVFFGVPSLEHMPGWIAGDLRGMDIAPAEQMSQSEGLFWALIGSFAAPLILLGLLVSWLGKASRAVPAFVGWGIGIWVVIGVAIMEPSGFPLGLIPVVMLFIAARMARQVPVGPSGR